MEIKTIKVRDLELGGGVPKICVPVTGRTRADVLEQLDLALGQAPDCIELRADCYDDILQENEMLNLLAQVRERLENRVLLFTFRSVAEGGKRQISDDDYRNLCIKACQSGFVDLLDVEVFAQEGALQEIREAAVRQGVYLVASSHDFRATPEETELIRRLRYMERQGADILKIAVMPQRERDVLTLLSATLRYYEEGGDKPVITMSMGKAGMISRLSGELFGSALTFATAGAASAPGQLPVEEVRQVFAILHRE
ncbi:MAG: type I 3-dehydroquinate dehydratase [Clostridium sp.]|nr:type I 3-dehydroquinate dehydratase [Clostridium sp.]